MNDYENGKFKLSFKEQGQDVTKVIVDMSNGIGIVESASMGVLAEFLTDKAIRTEDFEIGMPLCVADPLKGFETFSFNRLIVEKIEKLA